MTLDSNPGAFLVADASRAEPADGSDLGPIKHRPVTQVAESLMTALEQEAKSIKQDGENQEHSTRRRGIGRERLGSEVGLDLELTSASELEAYVKAIGGLGVDVSGEEDLSMLASNLMDSPDLDAVFPAAEFDNPVVRAERSMNHLESFLRVMQSNLEPPAALAEGTRREGKQLPRLSSLFVKTRELDS